MISTPGEARMSTIICQVVYRLPAIDGYTNKPCGCLAAYHGEHGAWCEEHNTVTYKARCSSPECCNKKCQANIDAARAADNCMAL